MEYNTVIVGAGPAGMAAALYLKRSGISVLLIDKDAPGGQMLKASKIDNYLGFKEISGVDLALQMFEQMKYNNIPFKYGEVTAINKNNGYDIYINDDVIKCKYVVLATGKKPFKLGLDLEDKITGISYCAVCDGSFYKNKVVGIVGGGNSAFSDALYLADLCEKVYVFVRSKVRANDNLVKSVMKKKNVEVIQGEIVNLREKDDCLNKVVLNNGTEYHVSGLFVAIGGKPQIDFIKGLRMEDGFVVVDERMETTLQNVYACGDVVKKDYYQIALAISDGITAALSIKEDN